MSLSLYPLGPFLQIVGEYGKDGVVTDVLNAMDIFLEIVSNPDGFAYTHSMVRAPEREGLRDQGSALGGMGERKVTVALGCSAEVPWGQTLWGLLAASQ